MHSSSTAYTQRLMRMRTLAGDCRFASSVEGERGGAVAEAEAAAAAAAGGEKLRGRYSGAAHVARGAGKYSSGQLWMRSKPDRQRVRRRRMSSLQQQQQQDSQRDLQLDTEEEKYDGEEDETLEKQQLSILMVDRQTNNSKREQPAATASSSGGSRRGGGSRHQGSSNASASASGSASGRASGSSKAAASAAAAVAAAAVASQLWSNSDFAGPSSQEEEEDDSEPEVQNSSNAGEMSDVFNENAVAKGANALVKQATSRQTEIIDTSKLLEEGKVEVQYEEPEDEPEEIEETDYKLIDEYEKTFAYARRLRALLNMKFKVMDKGSIETNFLMVKAHEHPTQRVLDRWRNVDLGHPYDSQIRQKKLIDDFKATCGQKKKPKKGEVRIPVYPEWLKFIFRFKKDNAEKRWTEFTAYRQRMKKLTGGKTAVPKANDRYLPAYYDVWSTSVVVFAKPETTVLNMVDPLFAKLGLDARADFKFTLGCFIGDKRAGKAKVQGAPSVAEEITMQVLCGDLYKRNCAEIFVNDNRIEMYKAFPTFYEPPTGPGADSQSKESGGKKGKKDGKKDKKKGGKNQSNLDSFANASSTQQQQQLRLVRRLQRLQRLQKPGDPDLFGSATAASADASSPAAATSQRQQQLLPQQQQQQEGGDTATTASALDAAEVARGGLCGGPNDGVGSGGGGSFIQDVALDPSLPVALVDACEALAAAVMEKGEVQLIDNNSSPSATNQNLSVHDCNSSDESQHTVEEVITTTKTAKTETPSKKS